MLSRTRCWSLAGVLLLLGAASPVPLTDQWKLPDLGPVEFRKVLVLGITDDEQTRHRFEEKFCSHVRSTRTECVVSYSLVPDLGHIEAAEEIKAEISAKHVDAALTVRLVPLSRAEVQAWPERWKQELDGGPRLRVLIEQALPIAAHPSKQFGVDVGLWQVADGARVWAGRTDVITRKRLKKGESGSFIESVIHQLRRADLI